MNRPSSPRLRDLAPLLLAAALLSSCATASTVQSRIAARPDDYSALSSSHRALVNQGRIKEGMSKQAVYLAWGSPDGIREGSSGGKHSETWVYESYRAIYSDSVGIGYGYSNYYGRPYSRRGGLYGRGAFYDCYPYGGFSSFAYGTDVHYEPFVSSVVTFSSNRVTSWEQARR